MKQRSYVAAAMSLLTVAAATLGFILLNRSATLRQVTVRRGTIDYRISANGRTEGVSEELKLGSKVPGRIQSILVEEGERIKKDQVIAVLENNDLMVTLEMQKAALKKAEARLELVSDGPRPEERDVAALSVERAQAIAENARVIYRRYEALLRNGIVSRDQIEQAEKNLRTADIELETARKRYQLITTSPRYEEVAEARADVAVAQSQVKQAQINYENSFIRSPINGIVLKKYMRPGESITFESVSMPLLSIADNSKVLVRAEVDETDVSKIRLGQEAEVTADSYPGETFRGRVIRISGGLGRKAIATDDPTEKIDTEILEAMIELDPGAEKRLKLGLRVDVTIRIAHKENVLVVPIEAIHKRSGKVFVQVKRDNGWVSQPVTVGVRDYAAVEILTGLEVNDVVSTARLPQD